MKNTPTGQEVLDALSIDPRYVSMQQDAKDVITPYIIAAPEALGDTIMSSKVTAVSFVQAKLNFLEYCLQNGLAEKSADLLVTAHAKAKNNPLVMAMKINLAKLPPRKDLVKQAKKAFEVLIQYYKEVIVALPKAFDSKDQSESELLVMLGLSVAVADQCVSKQLTVADLLVLEPASILLNGGNK